MRPDLLLALFWSLAAGAATAAVFPYLAASFPRLLARTKAPLPLLAAAQSAQAVVLIFLLVFLALRCRALTGLDSPVLRAFFGGEGLPSGCGRKFASAALLGAALGILLVGAAIACRGLMPGPYSPLPKLALWKRLLACFYGGVTEECLIRLFLVSGFVWLLAKLLSVHAPAAVPAWIFWLGIVFAAVLFGVGHLPVAASLWPLNLIVISRTILFNAIGGIFFGWVFWVWGFEYAVTAHFCADLLIQGFAVV